SGTAADDLVQALDLGAVHRALADRELEPVVLGRVVRSCDLNAADDVEMVQAPVVQRRRHDPDVRDVDARRGETVDERVAELRTTRTVVAADGDGAKPLAVRAAPLLAEIGRVGAADGARRLGREVAADD